MCVVCECVFVHWGIGGYTHVSIIGVGGCRRLGHGVGVSMMNAESLWLTSCFPVVNV